MQYLCTDSDANIRLTSQLGVETKESRYRPKKNMEKNPRQGITIKLSYPSQQGSEVKFYHISFDELEVNA
jgi:CO dehydrogenase nickel-insertion accessory protein CooC1